jgi:hypothetical protein
MKYTDCECGALSKIELSGSAGMSPSSLLNECRAPGHRLVILALIENGDISWCIDRMLRSSADSTLSDSARAYCLDCGSPIEP